ncbi:DUF3040 domain-containing protein [Streptomyces bathyalis]|uniref:DUF3040 domain-containing protein n=1 Tax=Streptomyces bathyalis TaxID=2710756 RepID=A0A7T1T470_9ACTN|nr:DUF3040 domain-containing protein [Streptomyces bathyalis]QPP06035.1 DUF3040 domain-containing protein [Streptomyces bathyalis]
MLSKREREQLAAMDAALTARDPRWTKQFTDIPPGPRTWSSVPARLTMLLLLSLVSVGIVSASPVVDTIIIIALITIPAAVLLVLARRDARPPSPAP